jgi:hypothetical protein
MNSRKNNLKAGLLVSVFILSHIFGDVSLLAQVSTPGISCTSLSKTLKFGGIQSRGDVIKLQDFLYKKGYLSLAPTGYFGRLTESAVKFFQKDNGILSNGIAGPITRGRVSNISCTPQVISVPVPPIIQQTVLPIPTLDLTNKSVETKNFSLPYSSSDFSGWQARWGSVSTSTIYLGMDAQYNTNGSGAVFPLSKDMTDYRYSVNVFLKRGSFSLVARYVDDDNFLACNFGGRVVEIIQKVNGVSIIVSSAYVSEMPNSNFFFQDLNVSMNVKGNKVGCVILGAENNVEFRNIDGSLLKGAIGIQNWNEALGVASLELKKIDIQPI